MDGLFTNNSSKPNIFVVLFLFHILLAVLAVLIWHIVSGKTW